MECPPLITSQQSQVIIAATSYNHESTRVHNKTRVFQPPTSAPLSPCFFTCHGDPPGRQPRQRRGEADVQRRRRSARGQLPRRHRRGAAGDDGGPGGRHSRPAPGAAARADRRLRRVRRPRRLQPHPARLPHRRAGAEPRRLLQRAQRRVRRRRVRALPGRRRLRRHVHRRRAQRAQRHRRRVQREPPRDLHRGRSQLQRLRHQPHPAPHHRPPGLLPGAPLLPDHHLLPGRHQQPGRRARADRHRHRDGAEGEQARVHQRRLQPGRPLPPDLQPGSGAPVHLPQAEQQGEPRVRRGGGGGLPQQGGEAGDGGRAQDPGGQGQGGVRRRRGRQRVPFRRDAVRQGPCAGAPPAVHRHLLGRREHHVLRRDRGVRRRVPLRRPHLQRLQLRRLLPAAQAGEGHHRAARPRGGRQRPGVRVHPHVRVPPRARQAPQAQHHGVRQLPPDLRPRPRAAQRQARRAAQGQHPLQAHQGHAVRRDRRRRRDRRLVVQLPEAQAPRGLRVRVPDAVRLDRVVGRRDARVRPGGQGQACHRVHRRWKLPGDGARRVDDAPVRAEEHHLPHQQRRVHHRGGDPRRPVQRDQELGLHGAHQRHPQRRRQLLDHEGSDGGGAQGGDRHGDGRQERLPLLHRGDRAQGRHQQGAPRVGLQGLRRQQQAAQPPVSYLAGSCSSIGLFTPAFPALQRRLLRLPAVKTSGSFSVSY